MALFPTPLEDKVCVGQNSAMQIKADNKRACSDSRLMHSHTHTHTHTLIFATYRSHVLVDKQETST